ncbi:ATP-grasp domain-containing protein [Carnobacterium gallinarum]|uniref:ATP-grasp domain-containing protein n=1 Tax=Carnobacterium gallinarum TaxID=2749 RepID=UPI00054D7DCB|nr:ATP-grasp domain-containing protein [Carnobacterium gallinarum]
MDNYPLLMNSIFDTEDIFNPRVSFDDYGFLPKNPQIFDMITGREFAIMGNQSIICSENVNQNDALELLKYAGLSIPKEIYRYKNPEEYHELLSTCAESNQTLIMQYPHKKSRLNYSTYHVSPEIILDLSDKTTLEKLVSLQHIPPREIITYDSLKELSFTKPIVIKNGDGTPTAGGYGVYICMNAVDLAEAILFFDKSPQVIIETYIHPEENFCVQFACSPSGEISYLGTTAQLILQGIHKGNILGTVVEVNSAIVTEGISIMKKAFEQGFHGIAGFDVIISNDQFYFIDLNFRLNASTAPLLLMPFISQTYSKDNAQLSSFAFQHDYPKMLEELHKLVDSQTFIPLSIWNPEAYSTETSSSVIGLTLFNTEAERIENSERLAELGFKNL